MSPPQIKKLVEHMIELEPFMRCTMQRNDELEAFLALNKAVEQDIRRLSSDLKEVLWLEDEEESMMDDYIIAFDNMVRSRGYSMEKLLNNFPALASFFQYSMGEIGKIYYEYLLCQKAQLTEALIELSDQELSREDVAMQAKAISKQPLVCTKTSPTKLRFARQGAKIQKYAAQTDETYYNNDESLMPA